jgi:effector-binding domain-containing protein
MASTPTIKHREVDALQIASSDAVIQKRADILPLFESLRASCRDAVCGPAMALIKYGAVKDGLLVEAAYPVSRPVETWQVRTRLLPACQAWTAEHHGPHDTIRETTRAIVQHVEAHAGTIGGGVREIYQVIDLECPERSVTEVQVLDHEWDRRLAAGVDRVLGPQARQQVMAGIERLTPDSPADKYRDWVHTAMRRIDSLTDDPVKKYQMVSCAAHVFPPHRIDLLRALYEQRYDVDDVLREMYRDPDWYEDPVRRGNRLYMRKVPFDAEAYKTAATAAERRQAYCHCAFVRPYLTESPAGVSPTFCWCGAGWYRQLWEGVLGRPIQVEHVETLVKGNDCCTLVITLPISAEGELSPEMEAQ